MSGQVSASQPEKKNNLNQPVVEFLKFLKYFFTTWNKLKGDIEGLMSCVFKSYYCIDAVDRQDKLLSKAAQTKQNNNRGVNNMEKYFLTN